MIGNLSLWSFLVPDEGRNVLDENGVVAIVEEGEAYVPVLLLYDHFPENYEENYAKYYIAKADIV